MVRGTILSSVCILPELDAKQIRLEVEVALQTGGALGSGFCGTRKELLTSVPITLSTNYV